MKKTLKNEIDLPELFKRVRLSLGVSQYGMADIMQTDQASICLWENALRTPRISTIKKLFEVINKHHVDVNISFADYIEEKL